MDNELLRRTIEAEIAGLVAIRHDLHAHPELMFQEHRTSKRICEELDALGIEYRAGLARGTGVVGYIPATDGQAKQGVGLRADMDALPIVESTGKAYASTMPGVMHACGHDGHTTILLGAARVLMKLEERPNPVTLIFQPAEEGGAGGEKMCEDGALLGKDGGGVGDTVGRVFGLHGWPTLEAGTVGTRPGPLLAATDEFDIEIQGTGGHAAYPHLCKDPILAASQIVCALQSLVSREVMPQEAAVCTVSQFSAGSAHNIIPDVATIAGTMRSLSPATRTLMKDRLFEIVHQIARAMGCQASIDWHDGYPVTRNDAELAELVLGVARSVVGAEKTQLIEHPTMGGEDFAYYGNHVPACFFYLGLVPRGAQSMAMLHQPGFDFNDDAIGPGIEMMCRLALTKI